MAEIIKEIKNVELELDRGKSITVDGNVISFVNISKFGVKSSMNDHSEMELAGEISSSMREVIGEKIGAVINVKSFQNRSLGMREDLLFAGIIEKIEINEINKVINCKIYGKSFSAELDRIKRKVSYQDITKSYSDMIDLIKTRASYEKLNIIGEKLSKSKLEQLFIQYNETDWEFLKRTLSNIGECLVVESSKGYESSGANDEKNQEEQDKKKKWALYVGIPERGSKEIDPLSVKYENTIKENKKSSYLRIRITDIMQTGDKVSYKGKKYIITEVITEYNERVIKFDYKLVEETLFKVVKIGHENIAGKGILAKVKEIGKAENLTRVRVDFIFEDVDGKSGKIVEEKKDGWDNYWFRYSTQYSGTNSGIYIMPEIGDMLMVQFSGNSESSGYAAESIREQNSLEEKDSTETHKRIMIPTGQQLILSEKLNKVRILGNKDRSVYMDAVSDHIELFAGDAKGVMNKEGITFEIGDSKITMNKGKLSIKCGSSEITLEAGGKVNVKGS